MSDEDRDVDVESDEDDDGSICLDSPTGAQASAPYLSQAEKRAHHNALERKRRDHIKESFHSLRDSVPALEGEKVSVRTSTPAALEKVSRAQILKKAADYIQFMRRKNHSHQQDIDDLKKQNNILEQQIRSLEKAKSTGTFANQSGAVNLRGGQVSAFDGGSESESSDLEDKSAGARRKKLKTAPS